MKTNSVLVGKESPTSSTQSNLACSGCSVSDGFSRWSIELDPLQSQRRSGLTGFPESVRIGIRPERGPEHWLRPLSRPHDKALTMGRDRPPMRSRPSCPVEILFFHLNQIIVLSD
jgi:hypothetical protein